MIKGVALFVISGVSAAGKSTVARLLAQRFDRGVCVPGDAIHAMVVGGRLDMRPASGEGALRQLVLRYAGALAVASVYLENGFDVVVEDVIIGPVLRDFLGLVPVPEFHLVFLDPDEHAIEQREQERDGTTYGPARWSVSELQALLRQETNRLGLAQHDRAQRRADCRGYPRRPGRQPRPPAPEPLTRHQAEQGEQTEVSQHGRSPQTGVRLSRALTWPNSGPTSACDRTHEYGSFCT